MISAADYLSGKTTSQTKKYGGPVTVRAEDYLKALELPEIKEISAPKAAENSWVYRQLTGTTGSPASERRNRIGATE